MLPYLLAIPAAKITNVGRIIIKKSAKVGGKHRLTILLLQTTRLISNKLYVQQLENFGETNGVFVDVLRLDMVHPIVSGNKWFKLKLYIEDALKNNFKAITTFGGAFSNHIVATAAACKNFNLKCFGIIRGEESKTISHTLQNAIEFGMELIFVDRENYKNKIVPASIKNNYLISEGGFGSLGGLGFATVFNEINIEKYSHIICACGTGTTIAGVIKMSLPHQKVIGINVLKGYEKIEADVRSILEDDNKTKPFTIFNNYHFGGYAKKNDVLISFMNELWINHKLPTDFVYTAKLFYAVKDLIEKKYFDEHSNILIIHSGGLQGNLSLNKGTLLF